MPRPPRLEKFGFLLPVLLLLGLLLSSAGCRKPTAVYYEVPREQSSPVTANMGATSSSAQASGPRLEWDKPAAWTEQARTEMRLASYAFTDANGAKADISVTSFPDAAGGLLANVNRWRKQVGLGDVAAADLESTAQRTEIAGQAAWLVDFAGTPEGSSEPTRIIGAIVPVGGTSWFFKMMGPDAVVISQREAFQQMVRSIRAVTPTVSADSGARSATSDPAASNPNPSLNPLPASAGGGAPMAAGSAAGASVLPPAASAAGFTFTAPSGWQQQPSTQFRVINFIVPGSGVPAAEFYVTPLTGAAGGELANVNRWRGQLGLQPIGETELREIAQLIETPAGTFQVFDLVSAGAALKTGQRARMLAAILKRGETTWFFRMTGEADHVASQRQAFEQFLRSCQFDTVP